MVEVATKICTKCGEEKGFVEFHKQKTGKFCLKAICKRCEKQYYQANKEQAKKWRESNKHNIKEYSKKYYEDNKHQLIEQQKQYYQANKHQLIEQHKQYYQANKHQLIEYQKQYRQANKEQRKEYDKQYVSNRRQTDELYKLSMNMRTLIGSAFRNKGYKKTSKTANILGCTFEELYAHIESQFEYWMSWDNYGKYNGELNFGWDIDHIIPSSSANTLEELIKLNHYTNLQPLCSKINRDIKRHNF